MIGNGYVGLSLSTESHIQLISDVRAPFISTGYSPVVQISSNVWEDSRATVVQINQGLVRRIQCFKISEESSGYVTHSLYAHRRRPSLIIQEIEIINPTQQTLDLNFRQKKPLSRSDIKQIDKEDIGFDTTKDKFSMTTNQVSTRQHNSIIVVIITNKDISTSPLKPNRYFRT
jgi:hypothetical protein